MRVLVIALVLACAVCVAHGEAAAHAGAAPAMFAPSPHWTEYNPFHTHFHGGGSGQPHHFVPVEHVMPSQDPSVRNIISFLQTDMMQQGEAFTQAVQSMSHQVGEWQESMSDPGTTGPLTPPLLGEDGLGPRMEDEGSDMNPGGGASNFLPYTNPGSAEAMGAMGGEGEDLMGSAMKQPTLGDGYTPFDEGDFVSAADGGAGFGGSSGGVMSPTEYAPRFRADSHDTSGVPSFGFPDDSLENPTAGGTPYYAGTQTFDMTDYYG